MIKTKLSILRILKNVVLISYIVGTLLLIISFSFLVGIAFDMTRLQAITLASVFVINYIFAVCSFELFFGSFQKLMGKIKAIEPDAGFGNQFGANDKAITELSLEDIKEFEEFQSKIATEECEDKESEWDSIIEVPEDYWNKKTS